MSAQPEHTASRDIGDIFDPIALDNVACQDVYLLMLHEPYDTAEHPVSINVTIVHALTLLHPGVPQPDGGMIYRCLTEFPQRTPGCVVPLSTLTFELNGGRWWHKIGDWKRVTEAVVQVARAKGCDAMPLGVPHVAAALLAGGPNTDHEFYPWKGCQERQEHLADVTRHVVHTVAARGPFWPGDDLVAPPPRPPTMPYQPHHSSYEGLLSGLVRQQPISISGTGAIGPARNAKREFRADTAQARLWPGRRLGRTAGRPQRGRRRLGQLW